MDYIENAIAKAEFTIWSVTNYIDKACDKDRTEAIILAGEILKDCKSTIRQYSALLEAEQNTAGVLNEVQPDV